MNNLAPRRLPRFVVLPIVSLLLAGLLGGCVEPHTDGTESDTEGPEADAPASPVSGAPEEGPEAESAAALNAALPEAPALARDVAMIAGGQYAHPTTPAFRTSADGRVSMNLKGPSTFRLLRPEQLAGPFAAQPPGVPMIAPGAVTLADSALHAHNAALGAGSVVHRTLCDGTVPFPKVGAQNNPYTCGPGGVSDCYDLTILAAYPYTDAATGKAKVELWGTPVTVTVTSPKTAAAAIAGVVAGVPVKGPTWAVNNLFEPMVTADGHLLVARTGGSTFTWQKSDGAGVTGKYDIVYSVAGAADAPCDVTRWTQLYPISHAPFHTGLRARYGFAEHQLRDPEGALIADGAELKGTYPWIDRRGNNLFFTTVSPTLYYTDGGVVKSRYPASCVPGVACSSPATSAAIGTYDEASNTRGVSVAGLWTHGKIVLLDNLLNNVDYGLRVPDDLQRMLALYQPGTGPLGTESGAVRAGSGRYAAAAGMPAVGTANVTFIDSLENLFQHAPSARSLAVRDVVWTVNSGKGSDEVVFDDYLDPDALIVSEMSGSLSFAGGTPAGHFYYHDGFVRTGSLTGSGFDGSEVVRVQNAATALPARWKIPPYGKVTGGARLEPVALGGIRGKGLWLDGDDAIEYTIAAQPQDIHAAPLYVSVFLDSRFADDTTVRRLFTFPDGSAIEVVGRHAVRFRRSGGAVQVTYGLPAAAPLASKGFSHLGFTIDQGGGRVKVHLDGYLYRTWTSASVDLFRFVPGTFRVGAAPGVAGVRGWIDEVKVLASAPDPEVACNHARGTLIGLPAGYAGPWAAVASRYPATSHAALTDRLVAASQPAFDRYACFHDYLNEHGAHLGNVPVGTASVRQSVVFPEGVLVWDEPRPDSSQNTFCLGCHVSGQRASLTPAALAYDPTRLMSNDRRRQPLQPPRLVFGNVPPQYVPATGLPSAAYQTGPGGTRLDQWVFP